MNVKKMLIVFLAFVTFIFPIPSAAADEAYDVTAQCCITSTDTEKKPRVLTDDDYRSYVTIETDGYVQVALPPDTGCGGLYIKFRDIPLPYTVEWQAPDSNW